YQNDLAVPVRLERGAIPELEAELGLAQVAHHDLQAALALPEPRENDRLAVAQRQDGGQCLAEAGEPPPRHLGDLGAQPHLVGHPDEIAGADAAVTARARNLQEIGLRQIEAVETRDSRETGQAGQAGTRGNCNVHMARGPVGTLKGRSPLPAPPLPYCPAQRPLESAVPARPSRASAGKG